MGMFDDVKCHPSLLDKEDRQLEFQTKDLANALDLYEIREDGTLWRQEYDVEDHSDPEAEGIGRIFGMMTRVNNRWVQVEDITDTIRFYDYTDDEKITYVAQYTKGELTHFEREAETIDY